MIDNSKNPQLMLAYTSANGTKFYSLVNVLEISALRGLSAEKAKRFMELNITERSLRALIDEYKAAAKENDVNKFHSIVYEIGYRLEFLSEENSALDLACIYFFLEDENPEVPSEAHNKRKHQIFNDDLAARGFFLRIALSLCRKFSEKQESDMLTYFQENQALSERILKFIQPEYLLNSMNTSTNSSTTAATGKSPT